MQIVETVDKIGRKRRYMLDDDDNPEDAAEIGIDIGVPDLSQIDWNKLMVEVSNALYDKGVFTPDDIRRVGNAVTGVATSIVGKAIIKLYGA